MAEKKATTPAPAAAMPGIAPSIKRHAVLYVRREPTSEFQPLASYELGDKEAERQGGYLFDSIRAEQINNARASAAQVPFFLEQVEEGGFKVEV